MKNFLTYLTFILLMLCFGTLIVGVALGDRNDRVFTQMFALFFVLSATAFLGYLKAINNKNK